MAQINVMGEYRRLFSVYIGPDRDLGPVVIVINSQSDGQIKFGELSRAQKYLTDHRASEAGLANVISAWRKEVRAVRKRSGKLGINIGGASGKFEAEQSV